MGALFSRKLPAEATATPPPPPKPSEPFSILHTSTQRRNWDLVMFGVVIFISINVPLRIGFDIREWRAWLAFDLLTDLLILTDIIITLHTTFEEDGEVVTNRRKIAMRYFRGWMIPDMLSVIPLLIIAAATHKFYPVYRVNTLLQTFKLLIYFGVWEKTTSLKPSVVRILKSAFVILFLSHFIGCIFFLLVILEGDEATYTFTGTPLLRQMDLSSQYLRAFYWAFVSLTGYNNTNPRTNAEAIFSIIVTMLGITLFATIIGTVGSLVTNLDSSALYFRQKMDSINDYMKYKRIPADLQVEVRNYFAYLWRSGKGLDKNKVLDDLPPYLKAKMNVILNSEIIRKVPLFDQCKDDTDFINEIVKWLRPRVCLPNSYVVRKGEVGNEMFFISRGELNVVSDEEKVVFTLRDGGFFGEIALLYDTKRTASIVARTYCDMFILTKEDFKKVLKKFPAQSKGIKEIAKERFQAIVDNEKKKEEAERVAKLAQVQPQPTRPPMSDKQDDAAEDDGKDEEMKPLAKK